MKKILLCILFLCLIMFGCRKSQQNKSATYPKTISLSPALTKMIFQMGLEKHLVGVTNFCDQPKGVNLPKVGDTKSLNNEQILSLDPDLIICQGNLRLISGIKQYDKDLKVEKVTLESLNDIPATAFKISQLLGSEKIGAKHRDEFLKSITEIKNKAAKLKSKRVLFVMGTRRPTIAAEGSFINDMILVCGGVNSADVIAGQPRWRDATIESIHKSAPDVIICQIFNSAGKDDAMKFWTQWKDLSAVQNKKVFVVDDPDWTIPSLKMADYCRTMFEFIHGKNK